MPFALSRTFFAAAATAAAALTLSAPTAQAFTATPLGRCVEPSNAPVLENLAVSNPTSVTADGTPRGQIGITLRTKSIAYRGGPIMIEMNALDPWTGRLVSGWSHTVGDGGCKRYTFKMAELSFKLQRQRFYLVRVNAFYTDPIGQSVIPSLDALLAPSALVWVQ